MNESSIVKEFDLDSANLESMTEKERTQYLKDFYDSRTPEEKRRLDELEQLVDKMHRKHLGWAYYAFKYYSTIALICGSIGVLGALYGVYQESYEIFLCGSILALLTLPSWFFTRK